MYCLLFPVAADTSLRCFSILIGLYHSASPPSTFCIRNEVDVYPDVAMRKREELCVGSVAKMNEPGV